MEDFKDVRTGEAYVITGRRQAYVRDAEIAVMHTVIGAYSA